MILHDTSRWYFVTFAIQYFHTKFTTFDGFTSVYDNRISADTWNLPKVVSEIWNSYP